MIIVMCLHCRRIVSFQLYGCFALNLNLSHPLVPDTGGDLYWYSFHYTVKHMHDY